MGGGGANNQSRAREDCRKKHEYFEAHSERCAEEHADNHKTHENHCRIKRITVVNRPVSAKFRHEELNNY